MYAHRRRRGEAGLRLRRSRTCHTPSLCRPTPLRGPLLQASAAMARAAPLAGGGLGGELLDPPSAAVGSSRACRAPAHHHACAAPRPCARLRRPFERSREAARRLAASARQHARHLYAAPNAPTEQRRRSHATARVARYPPLEQRHRPVTRALTTGRLERLRSSSSSLSVGYRPAEAAIAFRHVGEVAAARGTPARARLARPAPRRAPRLRRAARAALVWGGGGISDVDAATDRTAHPGEHW